ncbi:MAG: DUF4263 domain-containing protein [Daejeonella sp.]|uniref:Shedu immune nuclease family protein n=1 Tax=Daejeonella sp. TaxID=2805397 RepID=UPI0027351DD9|nr:Shedu immune nuclease family protein [Daejeonella sp.]MDP3467072.1 DUF4263 domain-containing protein [Daejeonella sp.]
MNPNNQKFSPNQENRIGDALEVERYSYCDESGIPVFLAKEIYKKDKKFIFYPYSVNPTDGSVKPKRIHKIELVGWNDLEEVPKDFKVNNRYGLKTLRAKAFFNALYNKFKSVYHYTVGINLKNSFQSDHITLNWSDLKVILNDIYREKNFYDREKAILIAKNLSVINSSIPRPLRYLPGGDLQRFLHKYSSYEKVNSDDLDALSGVLEVIPPSIINTTSNFINSKEQINKVYIEDIILKFEKLISSSKDNEKQWQVFFEKNSWILSHLFPYEVILREKEAYVGGKTIGNDNGRIIDFLFQNGFNDNYALLETKTHKKELLKKQVYRKPSVFSMSDELSGGISQCLDQKDTFLKHYGKENPSFDPKCILIIGMKSSLNIEQKHCFELLRSSQKNIEIVTFDEILMKLKGLIKVLNYTD